MGGIDKIVIDENGNEIVITEYPDIPVIVCNGEGENDESDNVDNSSLSDL